MTKYRVLKPLPRAKVGDELEQSGSCLAQSGSKVAVFIESGMIKDALSEGFIEEIKAGRRRNRGDKYYFLGVIGEAIETVDDLFSIDDELYTKGNYFKSEATAQLVAEAVKLMYEHLHNPENDKHYRDLTLAIDMARDAVLADDRSES